MFTLAKFVAFALLAVSTASAKPTQHNFLATCEYVLTPDVIVAPGTIDTEKEFNFVIETSLFSLFPNGVSVESDDSIAVENADNTFNVVDSIGVIGKTAKQNAAILARLVGTTHKGLANANGDAINWTFNSISCKV